MAVAAVEELVPLAVVVIGSVAPPELVPPELALVPVPAFL